MRIKLISLAIIFLTCSAGVFLFLFNREFQILYQDSFLTHAASFFESNFLDVRESLNRQKNLQSDHVILLDIDDPSLVKLGRWPWDRKILAKAIVKLKEVGAKVVVLDIFLSESQNSFESQIKSSSDLEFSKAITLFQSDLEHFVVLPYSLKFKSDFLGSRVNQFEDLPVELLTQLLPSQITDFAQLREYAVEKATFPIEPFLQTDVGLGHVQAIADSDGIYRHYALIAFTDQIMIPSLALKSYLVFKNPKFEVLADKKSGLRYMVNGITGELNQFGETRILWSGVSGDDMSQAYFPKISFHEFLDEPSYSQLNLKFKNKIVFIASTAYGANDLRHTPLSPVTPGVFTHMNTLEMLLKDIRPQGVWKSFLVSLVILFVGVFIQLIVDRRFKALGNILILIVLICAVFVFDYYVFIPYRLVLSLFFIYCGYILTYASLTSLGFHNQAMERQKIKNTFSRFLAPSVINNILSQKGGLKLGGVRKKITICFTDVRDFTTISEQLSPDQLSEVLNYYMSMMTDKVFKYSGTVDKYIGDALVSFWGAPLELKNQADLAIKATLEMTEGLEAVNTYFEQKGYSKFRHSIGLNTGECSVGNMGSAQIFSYTALGDQVNLGARLESLCKKYGVDILISEFTLQDVSDLLKKELKFRPIDKVIVKGKTKAIIIYQLIHKSLPLYFDDPSISFFCEAFTHYQSQEFSQALEKLTIFVRAYPDDVPAQILSQRCVDFNIANPGKNWDGSVTMKEK